MKKKIVALLLTLVMLVGIIPAAVYATSDAKVTLTVTPDKEIAKAGEEVTFTVSMETEEKLASMAFLTAFTEGLEYVDGSGAVDKGAKAAFAFDDVAWTEWSLRAGASKGDNYVNGYGSVSKAGEAVICTFKAKLADDAEPGEYSVDLTGLDEFCDLEWNTFDATDIEVISTPVVVEAEPKVILTVSPEKDTAVIGEEVTFTVTMSTEETLASMAFLTAFPEGLEYVDGSGAVDTGAKAAFAFDDVAWTEWSLRAGASKGDNYVNGYGSASKAGEAVICSFKVLAKELGEFEVGLAGLDEFCDLEWNTFDTAVIKVVSETLTVIDHVCSADKLTAVAGKDATCTEDGLKAYFECECGTKYVDEAMSDVVIDVVIPALGHTEADAVIENASEAACEEGGSYDTVVYCSVCDTELSRVTTTVDALGHTPAEAVKENEVAATCTEDGSYDSVVYCAVCGEELSRATTTVDALGHTEAAAVEENKVDATCIDDGSYDMVVYCSVCGEELSRESFVITATGSHTPGEVVRENEVLGNCMVDTTYDEVTYCTVCGEETSREEKTEVADGHDYVPVVTDPTATQGGYTTYTCSRCGDAYISDLTDKVSGKVVLTVANGNNTILTGIVNSDYSASVSVPKGVTIDTSSVTAGLTMTDVASLGISGTKSFEKVIATGVDKNIKFDDYIPTTFTGATVSGMIDGVAYGYEFVGENTEEAFTVYATPDAGVQPAWQALTSHISTANSAAADSYVLVPSPAYVQIGTEKLVFEDGKDSFKLDNLSGDTADEIRATVKLLNVEELEDAQIEIFLPAGTVLALSNTVATLEDDATITIYGYEDSEAVNTIMSQLRDCTTTTDIIKTLALFIGDVANAINGQDVTLNIEFDHIYDEWTVITPATCAEDGLKTKTCIMCGDVVEEVLPAFGHDYEEVVTEATCTEDGFTTCTCTICGDVVVKDFVEELGHVYEGEEIDPTCTEYGCYRCTCTVCGHTHETSIVDALGHDPEEAVVENRVEATCTEAGSYDSVVYCARCGIELSRETIEIAALGHTAAEAVKENEVAATCTAAGSYDSVVYCSVCGAEISREAVEIPVLAHTAGEAVKENEVAATCTAAGSYDSVVYCTACNAEMSREAVEVAALGHTYEAVVTAPTCVDGGFTTYTCSVCGDTYVADEVAAAGHTAGDWVKAEKAGYYNKFCSVCGVLLETTYLEGFDINEEYVKTKYVRKAPAFTLTAIVLPEDMNKDLYKVVWSSSNEKVATVDEDGNVTTHHLGTATITATLYDAAGNEIEKEACVVDVYYTFAQWLIWFFLLGCAWYFV